VAKANNGHLALAQASSKGVKGRRVKPTALSFGAQHTKDEDDFFDNVP
jgi:hypothetical protein